MSEVLKIASTIIRCISSWLGCAKCLEDIPSEKIVVHEETCNKTNNDTEKHKEHINIHKPSSVIFRRPSDENIQNSNAILIGSCQQLKAEEVDGRNNKAPVKPPRKILQTESNHRKRISINNPPAETSQINCRNKLTNNCSYDIADDQIACSFKKMKVPMIIVTTEEFNDYLSSSKSQNTSRSLLTSSTRSPRQPPQESSSYLNMPVPSRNMINIQHEYVNVNINKRKNMSTSTKIDSKSDIKESSFIIKLRNALLFFRKTPKRRKQ